MSNLLSSRRLCLLLMVVLGYFVLYAPQPLLPYFSAHFAIGRADVGLLMSAIMLPMCLSPLLMGRFFSRYSPQFLLHLSCAVLAGSVTLFAIIDYYPVLLLLRVVQGVFLPQLLTSVMVLLATELLADRLVKIMSTYVAATIVGGLLSRLASGAALEWLHWEWLFFFIGAALVVISASLRRVTRTEVDHAKSAMQAECENIFSSHRMSRLLQNPTTRFRLLSIACLFYVFSGMLNYATFRVFEISDSASQLAVGLLYVGYILGLFSSLSAQALSMRLGGVNRVSLLAYSVFLLAIGLTIVNSEEVLYFALFMFCGAMFLVHSLATAATNASAQSSDDRRLMNGFYLTFYYGGGVLGSYFPGLIYQAWGWSAFVAGLLFVALIGWGCLVQGINSESLQKLSVEAN